MIDGITDTDIADIEDFDAFDYFDDFDDFYADHFMILTILMSKRNQYHHIFYQILHLF